MKDQISEATAEKSYEQPAIDLFDNVVWPAVPILLKNFGFQTVRQFKRYLGPGGGWVADPVRDRFRNVRSLLEFDDTSPLHKAFETWADSFHYDADFGFAVLIPCLNDDEIGFVAELPDVRRRVALKAWGHEIRWRQIRRDILARFLRAL